MITTHHTPGPWNKDAAGDIWGGQATELCGRQCFPKVATVAGYMSQGDEARANAALIAAAPALLEAVQTAAAYLRHHHPADKRVELFIASELQPAIDRATKAG